MKQKYTQLEIERRWLVDEQALPDLSTLEKQVITDVYLENTRLRLRKIDSVSGIQYKLCKKYGKQSALSEPITNLYLSEAEYLALANTPGNTLVRERYRYLYQGTQFSINRVLSGRGPVIAEAEFGSEQAAQVCQPPPFCTRDVTSDAAFEAVRFVKLNA